MQKFIIAAVFLLISAHVAIAAECDTTLKPTDRYDDLSSKLKCLADEITLLKKSKGEPFAPALDPKKFPIVAQQTLGPFDMALKRCMRSAASISCLVIVASSKDTTLGLRDSTRLFDDAGNEIKSSNIQINNKSTRRQDLVQNVPVPIIIRFDNVNNNAKSIAAFYLESEWSYGGSGATVTFRNIPIDLEQ